MDYEGELVVVLAKDCKDVPADGEAWRECVAGYTCGDDVTWRCARVASGLTAQVRTEGL